MILGTSWGPSVEVMGSSWMEDGVLDRTRAAAIPVVQTFGHPDTEVVLQVATPEGRGGVTTDLWTGMVKWVCGACRLTPVDVFTDGYCMFLSDIVLGGHR